MVEDQPDAAVLSARLFFVLVGSVFVAVEYYVKYTFLMELGKL